ncbi:TPA: lipopolysaccharide heptosyltransferase family protein, partial [Campylobacter fetus subsp. venerealis]|nr:lipopolysaccharide heptosyltransferase family protein [Campylobacter fetus subsp. venerealis]
MKILLIRNDNIGDLICTTPAIEALRKHFRNDQIDIVVNS